MIGFAAKRGITRYGAGSFVRSHWHGTLPLAIAFWVNLVLLRGCILLAEAFLRPPYGPDPILTGLASMLYIVAIHVGLHGWQIVGVIRACDRYQATEGAVVPVYGAYLGIAISLLFSVTSAFTAVQTNVIVPLIASHTPVATHKPAYNLHLSDDGTTLYLNGYFDHGVTADLDAVLAQNATVTAVVLSSGGGNIFEARGVARLIEAHVLDTHVSDICASACTRAFIAGLNRTIAPGARLGFHAYRLDSDRPMPFVDIAGAQDTDRAFFRARKVKESFVVRMFALDGPDLWIPTIETLLEAGVATRIEALPARR